VRIWDWRKLEEQMSVSAIRKRREVGEEMNRYGNMITVALA